MVESYVAVLTFLLGVAVGAFGLLAYALYDSKKGNGKQ